MIGDDDDPAEQRRDWEGEERWHWEMEREAARQRQEEREQEEREEQAREQRETAIDEMVAWFNEQFEDPANDTPWDGEDKQYVYMFGGPFEARDVLYSHFDEHPEEWIEAAVDAIESNGIFEWAPQSSGDYYDHPGEGEDEPPIDPGIIKLELEGRLEQLERLIAQLPIAPPNVGHNMPPEEIGLPPYTDEIKAELEGHIADTREQVGSAEPNREILQESAGGFRKVAVEILKWLGRKGDLAVDEGIKAAVNVGIWTVAAQALLEVAEGIWRLIQSMG